MASAMCQKYLNLYLRFIATYLFISSYVKFINTNDYSVSNHSSFCSVHNCNFHFALFGSSLDQILQGLDKQFTYQIVDWVQVFECLIKLIKNFTNSKVENGRNYPVLQRNFERLHLSSVQKLACTKIVGSAFWKGIEIFKIQSMSLIYWKNIDCFLDDYCFLKSQRVNFPY